MTVTMTTYYSYWGDYMSSSTKTDIEDYLFTVNV